MTADPGLGYEIRVAGRLDDRWSSWFEGLSLCHGADGTSTLTGTVADQAQLHGILARLRDVGVVLLCCRAIEADDAGDPCRAAGRLSR